MELVNKNLVIDLVENQKLSYEQASSVLKERFPGVRDLSSQSVRRFCSKRSIPSKVSTQKVTEMVMEASSKVISAFWSWYYEKISVNSFTIILRFCLLFYSILRCFIYFSLSIPTATKLAFSNKDNAWS